MQYLNLVHVGSWGWEGDCGLMGDLDAATVSFNSVSLRCGM